MPSVQFKGLDQVLEAYKNRDVEVWALFDGKTLQMKGNGEIELEKYLEMITKGGTNATYTLKVYEEIPNAKAVKNNTPDDGSFNFKLNADSQEITGAQYSSHRNHVELLQRIEELEAKIEREPTEPEDKEVTVGSVASHILGMIKSPQDIITLIEVGKSLLGIPSNIPKLQPAIGNVNPGSGTLSQEEQLIRIGNAIEKLSSRDPRLVDHLEKLARIAEERPETFNFFTTTLEAMP